MQNILRKPQGVVLPSLADLQGALKRMDTATKFFLMLMGGGTWAVILYLVVSSFQRGLIGPDLIGQVISIVAILVTGLVSARGAVQIHKSGQNGQQPPTPAA